MKTKSMLFISILKISLFFLVLSVITNSNYAQAWTPDISTGITNHYGYVYSGSTSVNGKYAVWGDGWTTSGLQLHMRTNSNAYGRIIMASDGMLIRNWNPYSSISFSFRNYLDQKLMTIYSDNGDINFGTDVNSFPTSVKMRIIDGNYPSLMIAKTTSSTGDLSIAAGDGMYSNLAEEDDFILRSSSGSLILTARATEGDIKFATGDMDGSTWLGDSEKMIITQTGNVGIGTSTPSNELEVNGTIRSREIKVEATGWPDFVFSAEYKLMSLDNVETYIAENGHLPNISSAEKIEEEGVNVGEMQVKLLQKIEELTLYIIQQNKRIEQLENN